MPKLIAKLAAGLAAAAIGAGTAAAAVKPPALISGQILSPTITVGTTLAAPVVSLKFTAPGLLAQVNGVFTSPSGQTFNFYQYSAALPLSVAKSGTVIIQQTRDPFSIFAEPGSWTLSNLSLTDLQGTMTTYDAAQLAGLFSGVTLTVTNNVAPDTTPPTVSAGKIVTKSVSLSSVYPFFQVDMTVADNRSGVMGGNVFLQQPDGTPYLTYGTYGPGPVVKGEFQFGNTIAPGSPTGVWTITGFQVCDVATNCLTDTNAADVLKYFGKATFKVTP